MTKNMEFRCRICGHEVVGDLRAKTICPPCYFDPSVPKDGHCADDIFSRVAKAQR